MPQSGESGPWRRPVASPQGRTAFSPSQVVAISLAALVGAGTLLLRLPLSAQGATLSLINAFFTSASAVCVTGLNVIDTPNDLSTFGQVVLMLLMKVTTFSIVLVALWSMVSGIEEPVILKRRIPLALVARAFFICLIAFLATNLVAAVVLVVEHRGFVPTLFETTSAFGTVGLSMGVPGRPYSSPA